MKKWIGVLGLLLLPTLAFAQRYTVDLTDIYSAHTAVCTATALAATGHNRSGPYTGGLYLVYGYTSATDFTGAAMKCLQGTSAVTVNAVEGVKFTVGEKQQWIFKGDNTYISCQTGSGTGVYDVCGMR